MDKDTNQVIFATHAVDKHSDEVQKAAVALSILCETHCDFQQRRANATFGGTFGYVYARGNKSNKFKFPPLKPQSNTEEVRQALRTAVENVANAATKWCRFEFKSSAIHAQDAMIWMWMLQHTRSKGD